MNAESAADAEREAYLDERKFAIAAEQQQANSFDKWLITLASGAFGLSIAFFRYIAPEPEKTTLAFVILAWLSLAASIASTLRSFLESQKAHRRYVEILDDQYSKQAMGEAIDENPPNKFSDRVDMLNQFSFYLFLAGILFLAVFCISNVGNSMSKNPNDFERGTRPPGQPPVTQKPQPGTGVRPPLKPPATPQPTRPAPPPTK